MICLVRPDCRKLDRYLAKRENIAVDFESADIPEPPPAGFVGNHHRGCLGRGEETFAAARCALLLWRQFPGDWLTTHSDHQDAHPGQTVAVVARCLGVWSVNACRVTDTSESEDAGVARFSITYATLADHMLQGAERFCIEWDRADGRVWYDLSSYSRPRHWLARVFHRRIRTLQRRFANDSLAALQAAATAVLNQQPNQP